MNILNINSSSNRIDSISESYSTKILEQLQNLNPDATVVKRYTTYSDLPFLNQDMLGALFVKGERTPEQEKFLEKSNQLVKELKEADTLVISTPIYNFGIPASLKAYFDLVARAGVTFRYTENGPEGLLKNKKAYVVVSSGGTEIGSDIDFAGKYIKHFLAFIGITNVEIVKLDQLMFKNKEKLEAADAQIEIIEA
ncbi:FMN-dependent NADH-azoreductase [Aestuariivivens insulae]|uniref:FMN-dependent NADH-azoreductase n=1 Tax=Aestuariivivens insulae TaxID=1621988 RepID=UPI001F55E411|nr:NAD(P)H-dependent oxidoreductase [Aestuariivivens insulae]